MNNQISLELKAHIRASLDRHRMLEQEARDRQIEAQAISREVVQLEHLLSKWDVTASDLPCHQIIHELPIPVLILDAQGAVTLTNAAARKLLRVDDEISIAPSWLQDELLVFMYSGKAERSIELTLRQDEHDIPLMVEFKRTGAAAAQTSTSIIVTLTDISRYKNVEQALRLSEERYRMLVENQSDLVVKIDKNGIIQFASPSFSLATGIPEADLINCPFFPIISPEYHIQLLEKLHSMVCQHKACYEEFKSNTAEGQKWFGWSVKCLTAPEGADSGFICIGRDITEQKQAEQNIKQLAYYDILTGLPNRTLLHDRLLQAISFAKRNDKKTGVLFLDLDRFKTINDSLGHLAGDDLLQQVAQRLRDNVRDVDTVARQGGDEFVIILNAMEHSRQATMVASKIISTLSHPFQVCGQSVYTGASVGISIFPDDGHDVGTLLKHADMAMYLAKDSGRGKFKFFSQELNCRMRERLGMELALRQAIERDELFLNYQPQFNTKDRCLTGMEAFVRWKHPELGVLMPGSFIPLAEETGLIVPLGEWVLKKACGQAAGWQTSGKPPIPIAINLSVRQFRHPELLEQVAQALLVSGLPPSCLELELTESALINHFDESTATLQELKWHGVQLTIDDFGTGYSSLAQLRRFPIDRIKIDRSFIQAVNNNSDDAAIAEAIISVGQSLKLQVVAEGVERADQRDFLHARGCEEMQGNYFSRPLASDELAQNGWFSQKAVHSMA
jgi:diguanylate cyclase (GGDEF)-like protein/PAS domain S-box-containing protein